MTDKQTGNIEIEAVRDFHDEAVHLTWINTILDEELKKAEDMVRRFDEEYRDTKRYMAEYRGEIDPHEMFQTELLLRQTDRNGAFAVGVRDKITKLRYSPYFARIDFREGSGESDQYYIGQFAFSQGDKLLIFDWRSPVAGMFYDCETGPAGYDAPSGRIQGEMTRKRQFKIKDGIMEYVLESSDNIHDDVLQRELSHTSDERMKSIIATIQKEQNRIIRSDNEGTMIIQGVAGSGKTSIALHRIAFLLYRFRGRLSSADVAVISPNKVFADYISNVIPELGEEPVGGLSVNDIAQMQLHGVISFEDERDPLEVKDEGWRQRLRYKSTSDFVRLMDEYITDMAVSVFEAKDFTSGYFKVEGSWIKERFAAYGRYPLKLRIKMVAEDIHQRLLSDSFQDEDVPKVRSVQKILNTMLTVKNTLQLYKDFYRQTGMLQMLCMPEKKTLEWADVYPFMYMHAAFEGLKENKCMKHLVIDEMQDYTPIQYAVINLIFQCPKTILGDFGQSLNPCYRQTTADLLTIYEGAIFKELNKSYRSTYEIMTFAGRINPDTTVEAVERHGEEPAVILCQDDNDEGGRIKLLIKEFAAAGGGSMGIILKTGSAAKKLYESLLKDCELNLITAESTSYQGGISITSIRMAKGLEFDEVIIPHADRATYCEEGDERLLYTACTRAMHRLTLLYTKELSPFIV